MAEEEIHFVWILAHEARHLIQSINTISAAELRRSIQRLRRERRFFDLPGSTLEPLEVDSDIFALSIVQEFFQSSEIDNFFIRRSLPRCPFPCND